jgi:Uma2 family endonuclease
MARPFAVAPYLAAEVISPNDQTGRVLRKAARYLLDGVQVVWLINPERQVVSIYTQEAMESTLLGAEATLTLDVLPDFALPLSALFVG